MGFINMLRLGPDAGAMICDEESWFLRMRRTFFTVPVFFLVDPDGTAATGLEAVYAGIGTPNYQAELARRTRDRIRARADEKKPVTTLDEVGEILVEEMNRLTRWWADNHLRFSFGVTLDDYNRGYAEREEGRLEIAQEKVLKSIEAQIAGKKLPGQHKENHGLLMGYDAVHGFNGYNVKAEIGVLSQLSAGFEALGTGKYTACGVIAKHLNRVVLDRRRAGIDPLRAVLELYRASNECSTFVNESGGTLHFVYIDRAAKRRIHVYHHRSKLAEEIVKTLDFGLLAEADALQLIDSLLFRDAPIETTEAALFRLSSDAARARLLLRGYKDDERLAEAVPAPVAVRPSRGKRGA